MVGPSILHFSSSSSFFPFPLHFPPLPLHHPAPAISVLLACDLAAAVILSSSGPEKWVHVTPGCFVLIACFDHVICSFSKVFACRQSVVEVD